MLLRGKKILLGISGSIAAYKTPELVRQFIKQGAEVKVILTQGGEMFVAPLALSTVSKQEVLTSFTNGNTWHNHVALGMWADLLLIAPCSANMLSKMAHGACDNLLLATFLSAKCPVAIAPSMDLDMWIHPATQNNVSLLKSYNHEIIEPEDGELASGLVGKGRMPEPHNLVNWTIQYFYNKLKDHKKIAVVTAGPTYEHIDPVRFIGNHSSGKMGIALAEALVEKGYEVKLILGPSTATTNYPGITTINVTSAEEMFQATMKHFPQSDVAILAAAVADFTPVTVANEKIKKGDQDQFSIQLTKTKDILATLGELKEAHQKVFGFALETNNELANAQSKLVRKKADAIILNSLNETGAGFGIDTNKVYIITKDNQPIALPLLSKKNTAIAILDAILK